MIGETENGRFLVRDGHGKKYDLHRAFIDCGSDYEIAPGVWRHESDPTVLQKLRDVLKKVRGCAGCDVETLSGALVEISRILTRNSNVV